MAENGDEERFGDFKFISSSSSHSINGPDFSAKRTTIAANDDDDWGDFINSDNAISSAGSLPVNHFHFDAFPNSSSPTQPDSGRIRVESAKNQWAKLSGALPLSIFGEEDKEEEGSSAVDAGFNGVTGSFSFPKKDGNLKRKGSDLNELIADLYKQNEKGKEGNGFGSGLDVKNGVDLNPKAETWNWNGLNLGLNGSGFKLDALDLSGNAPALDKKENLSSNGDAFCIERKEGNLGSNGPGLSQNGLTLDSNGMNSDLIDDEEDDDGWEFRGAESKAEAGVEILKRDQHEPMSNFNVSTLSWDPLGTNAIGLNSNVNGVNSSAGMLNSSLVDENEELDDDDGWEFKTAESETGSGTGSAEVQGREQENPKGSEFGFGFGNTVNGPSMFFGTSGGISNKPGEWDLGFSFSSSFGSQSKQNDTKNGVISSPVDKNSESDKMSWAFMDIIPGNGSETKEEPKDADASSSGVEGFAFDSHVQGNEETLDKHKGAFPLSIFGDAELETDDSLRYEDVSTHKPTSLRAGLKDTRSNISINDLISSLYNQAEKNASLNHLSNPSENGLSSQTEVGSNLVNADDDFDDDSWEFKGAISGTRRENLNSPLGFGDSYEEYSAKMRLNDYVNFYSKLTTELCFFTLSHLDSMKKDQSTAAPGEDAEVKAIEKEIQGLYDELQKDGIISKELASENLQPRSIYPGEFAKVLEEKKFQVLESEYHISEKLSLAEKDLRLATELLKQAATTLKILKLGSVQDQCNYVSTWSKILSVCARELKHGASIWKQSLQKSIQSQLLSKTQGREYILALGEIFRVFKIVGSLSTKLYKPWILLSSEYPTNFLDLVRECSTLWSSSGLEEALQSLSDPTDLKYDVEALLGSILSIDDLDAYELYKQVFSRQEPTCYLSGLSAGTVPGMKMVVWDGQHYFLTIVNLWANLISRNPPNLPYLHARK